MNETVEENDLPPSRRGLQPSNSHAIPTMRKSIGSQNYRETWLVLYEEKPNRVQDEINKIKEKRDKKVKDTEDWKMRETQKVIRQKSKLREQIDMRRVQLGVEGHVNENRLLYDQGEIQKTMSSGFQGAMVPFRITQKS